MERINLSIPSVAREKLRGLAKQQKRKEAELARELLLDALQRAEREDFCRRVEEAMTDEARRHALFIAEEMEAARGQAG